jgi:hypothetical protein
MPDFSNASESFRRLNPEICGEPDTPEIKSERDLQDACERYLIGKGYARRTEGNILKHWPEKGWFVHLHKAQGNPLLLDLLILANDGRWIEVELKTDSGRAQRFQAEIIKKSHAVLVRNMPDFIEVLRKWEEKWKKVEEKGCKVT